MGVNSDHILGNVMGLEMLSRPGSPVVIMHNKEMPEEMSWVEYDADANDFTLVSETGNVFYMGFNVSDALRQHVSRVNELYLVRLTEEEKPKVVQCVPVALKKY